MNSKDTETIKFLKVELSLNLRIRIIQCYIIPVLLYECEGWAFSPSLENRITAFEMFVYRRMLQIPWIDKVNNVEVLRRMKKEIELLATIKKRKLQYIGHRGEVRDPQTHFGREN